MLCTILMTFIQRKISSDEKRNKRVIFVSELMKFCIFLRECDWKIITLRICYYLLLVIIQNFRIIIARNIVNDETEYCCESISQ